MTPELEAFVKKNDLPTPKDYGEAYYQGYMDSKETGNEGRKKEAKEFADDVFPKAKKYSSSMGYQFEDKLESSYAYKLKGAQGSAAHRAKRTIKLQERINSPVMEIPEPKILRKKTRTRKPENSSNDNFRDRYIEAIELVVNQEKLLPLDEIAVALMGSSRSYPSSIRKHLKHLYLFTITNNGVEVTRRPEPPKLIEKSEGLPSDQPSKTSKKHKIKEILQLGLEPDEQDKVLRAILYDED